MIPFKIHFTFSDGRQLTRFVQLGSSSGRLREGSPDPSCVNRTLLTDVPPVITSDNFYKEVLITEPILFLVIVLLQCNTIQ